MIYHNFNSYFNLMIEDIGKYYVYRYIRKDKNEVFYVGIGTKQKNVNFRKVTSEYSRAYSVSKAGRNKYFNKIVDKTNYYLEIVLESNDYDFILNKEIELVSLYGLSSEGGTLCNLSRGGDTGNRGIKMSDEQRAMMSRYMSSEDNHRLRKVINVDTLDVYPSVKHAAKKLGIGYSNLTARLCGIRRNTTNLIYLDDYNEGRRPDGVKHLQYRPVIDLDTGHVFNTVKECADYFGYSPSGMNRIIKGQVTPRKRVNIEYYDSKK